MQLYFEFKAADNISFHISLQLTFLTECLKRGTNFGLLSKKIIVASLHFS